MTSVFVTNELYFRILFYKLFDINIIIKTYKIVRTLSNVFSFIKLSSSYSHSTNVVNRNTINFNNILLNTTIFNITILNITILNTAFYVVLYTFKIHKLKILISHLFYYCWTFIISFNPYLKYTRNKFLLVLRCFKLIIVVFKY